MNNNVNNKISSHIGTRKKYKAPLPPNMETPVVATSSAPKSKVSQLLKKFSVKKILNKINVKINNMINSSKFHVQPTSSETYQEEMLNPIEPKIAELKCSHDKLM